MSVAEIDDGVYESTATIDNGSFGTRTIRFETGRLAQQAAVSVVGGKVSTPPTSPPAAARPA